VELTLVLVFAGAPLLGQKALGKPLPVSLDKLSDQHPQNVKIELVKRTSPKQLSAAAPFSPTGNPNETAGTLLASIAFHEAYHLGKIRLSRRLLGEPGALLAPR